VTGVVPAQRSFDRSETLAEQLEATRRRGCGGGVGDGKPETAANAPVVGTVGIAGPGARTTSRSRGRRAGDVLGAAAELPADWPVRDLAGGFPLPARAAE
jgi:hypothetical protein